MASESPKKKKRKSRRPEENRRRLEAWFNNAARSLSFAPVHLVAVDPGKTPGIASFLIGGGSPMNPVVVSGLPQGWTAIQFQYAVKTHARLVQQPSVETRLFAVVESQFVGASVSAAMDVVQRRSWCESVFSINRAPTANVSPSTWQRMLRAPDDVGRLKRSTLKLRSFDLAMPYAVNEDEADAVCIGRWAISMILNQKQRLGGQSQGDNNDGV